MKKWIAWGVVVLAIAAGVFAWRYRSAHAPAEVQYKTAPVEKRRIAARVTASGTLSSIVTVQVGSQVSGRVSKLFVDFNSPVKKGQLVAKIDPQLFDAAVAQANANYVEAQANVTKAKSDSMNADRQFARFKALHDQNLAAQSDLDNSEANATSMRALVDVAKANLMQVGAQLHQAQVNLSYTNITSPIDGVVISRNVDVGQTVAASFTAPVLFTIAQDLRKMQVDTNVSEGDVGRLQVGMPAFFTVDAYPGQRFKGEIGAIRNAAVTVQNVVTYDAVIHVNNDDLKLRPGMTANVTVTYAERDDVLAIPNAALRFRPPSAAPSAKSGGGGGAGGGARRGHDGGASGPSAPDDSRTIYRVVGVDAQPVTIKVGVTDGSYSEITEGDVHEGDAIAVDLTGSAAPAASSAGAASRAPRMF